MDQKNESVKVAVRVRPINKNEQSENATDIISIANNCVTIQDPVTTLTKNFGFDYIFDKTSSNENIYDALGKDIVQNACSGYNCCILAYGQTGSGKTYTMLNYKNGIELGLIPHIANKLLSISSPSVEYQIEVSFVEIYAEKIFDLLSDASTSLKLHINPKVGTYIEGLNSVAVSSIDQIMKLIEKGFKHRSTTATSMNEQSSRSHAIFNISFKQITHASGKIISEKISKIKLVDLAGSERVKTSKVSGVNFQEAISINKSLSMLSTVINELVENGSSTKYRNSILTALLADSISGNSKTIIIANVSPASIQYDISLQTLFYVHRTKKITVHAKINEITSAETQSIVNELKAEIERLKSELLKTTDLEEVKKLKDELLEYERLYTINSRSWSDKLKDSEETVSSLESELFRRNSVITEYETNIQVLTSSKATLLEEKKIIETEIRAKQDEFQTLLKTFNVEKEVMQNEKILLTNNIQELIIERSQLTHDIEILKTENMHMLENLTQLKDEKQSYFDKIAKAKLLFKPKK